MDFEHFSNMKYDRFMFLTFIFLLLSMCFLDSMTGSKRYTMDRFSFGL
jgi:hypothetical protein